MDDDAWEESIGWSGYANLPSDPNYGQNGGCIASKNRGTNSGGMHSGNDGYLWLRSTVPVVAAVTQSTECSCKAVNAAGLPSGNYKFTCSALTFSYTSYCDNDHAGGGWTMVSRMAKGQFNHMGSAAIGSANTAPVKERECSSYWDQATLSTPAFDGEARPDLCGGTWKLVRSLLLLLRATAV
jgi:hypothetical protein